jgi:hypothetical protein
LGASDTPVITIPPERNNPGYTPEYKELEEARELARDAMNASQILSGETPEITSALRWLAAEVRVMRLERALER